MATITNYGELKTAVADELHRRDQTARLPSFVAFAHNEISQWVFDTLPPLVTDADTNDVLTYYPDAYLFGAVARGLVFARDYESAAVYQASFAQQLSDIANSALALPNGLQVGANGLTP